ncbi:wee1 kinase-like protein [Volvox carteri f. nagariensis]|uniref:Wee1 kinase-like protein n=1 Tax=Volvox carteri f. nagariensis TaxID=3068 RepID=D8UE72_VOLCA|nr:wee1 kinase-like protein [Volvox carteri f. nagariensis]EFJ41915.1 wee1 kinase-like protein [Volvox carteri f. nagariensis]|eukprot:XP_002956952.1 wee1 kinase-like protein [Volvox carteri f. nagariensis]
MATASMKPSSANLFNYYNKQKLAQQCSESTNSLQLSMRHMNLQDQPQSLSQEPRPHMRSIRPRALDLSSQPSQEMQYTPDYLTPQEQLFRMDYEPSSMQLDDEVSRSPLPSPRAQKRPRPLKVVPSGCGDEECSSQSLSQSRSAGEPSTCSKALSGRPPIPKLREIQPPMPRNPYLVRADDDSHVFQASQSCLNRGNYSRFLWDYHQEAELGHGNFSKVYRAVHRLTGVPFAVKTNRSPITTLQARNMWLNEMQALAAVQHHPHIVGLYDSWFEPDVRGDAEQAFLKLELCGDSLGGVFKRRAQLKEQDVLDMLRQIASALKRIHELGMVHLDVKPDNIYVALVPARGGSPTACSSSTGNVYKLGDFGLAIMQGGQRAGTSEGDSNLFGDLGSLSIDSYSPNNDSVRPWDPGRGVRYLAPEALKSRDFLNSGLADRLDIFALGASAYELLRGSELPKNGQPYHDIRAGKIFLPGSNQRLVGLLKKMMAPDPAQRPTAEQLLKSSLLNPLASTGGQSQAHQSPLPLSQ